MIVAVGLLGPLPRSDNPSQATYTLGTCQTLMIFVAKNVARFWQILIFCQPTASGYISAPVEE